MTRRSLNVAMAGVKRWCIGVHFSNVGDTAEMVADEVVTFAASQLSRSVIADCVAVSLPSIDIAYSPKANRMTRPIRQAEQVAEPAHIHGVPRRCIAAVDAELVRPLVWARSGVVDDIEG